MATFFDLVGLVLAPKMCPDQSQDFKKVNNVQSFTVGSKKWLFSLDEPPAGARRHVCTKFRAKYSKN